MSAPETVAFINFLDKTKWTKGIYELKFVNTTTLDFPHATILKPVIFQQIHHWD